MQSSLLSTVLLPLALFIIMFGMGLTLTVQDFRRIWQQPKAVAVGLIAQLLVLPLVGFAIAKLLPLSPALAVGVIILAACPGGPTSNLFTFLAAGDVALSITLTALSSLITIFSIPWVVNLGLQLFLDQTDSFSLPVGPTVLQIAVITILPVTLAMSLRHSAPQLAQRADRSVRWVSTAFLSAVIVGFFAQERQNIVSFFQEVGGVVLLLNLLSMALGVALASITRLGYARATTIGLEVGIQNGTLAIAIAASPTLLNNPTMAIPAAIYSLVMFATGGAFAWWRQRYQPSRASQSASEAPTAVGSRAD
ncbi:bile acid:sodium symporter family protein [Synechococcus elongatus]|uniref:Bile acid:sodium symporter family protein n=1 Tax=Synechococcus elongatus PCC 11802 TaxID=2283154 RepID=A0AAT9K0B5_SYNEL|nr:bile acid:sodium symporter family protein [Synechococcus elongatus]QFZ91047.1 bile acid:sodium symporter family protein [Synechococcus elongatus PCC 11802]